MKILFLWLCGNILVSAQSLPIWFFEPLKIVCPATAVGLAERSSFNDTSAIKNAVNDAVLHLVRQNNIQIKSKKSFWTTALGQAMMDNDFYESFDTSSMKETAKSIAILDTAITEKFVVVLVSKNTCENFNKLQFPAYRKYPKPAWIDNLQQDEMYFYSLGMSPFYFYITSSFNEAERAAIYQLATYVGASISSLQKKSDIVEEMREEKISVALRNIETAGRWIDSKNKIVFVLLRIPK